MKSNDSRQIESKYGSSPELVEFLYYLNSHWTKKSVNNSSGSGPNNVYSINSTIGHDHLSESLHARSNETLLKDDVPAAFIQLTIMVIVFLVFFFLCKCNTMMESCRRRLHSESRGSKRRSFKILDDDDRYKDEKMSLTDYCCYLWYTFRMRQRSRRRRKRRLKERARKAAARLSSGDTSVLTSGFAAKFGKKQSLADEKLTRGIQNKKYRNDSLIFRRRSVIYRNSGPQKMSTSRQRQRAAGKQQHQQPQLNTAMAMRANRSSQMSPLVDSGVGGGNEGLREQKVPVVVEKIAQTAILHTIDEIRNVSKAIDERYEESTEI